jgi:hypothetical protein
MTSVSAVRGRRLSRPWIIVFCTIVMLVLITVGVVATYFVIPEWLGVEQVCLFGPTTTTTKVVTLGLGLTTLVSGLGVVVYLVLVGSKAGRRWSWALPPSWLALVLALAIVASLAVGPQPCDGGLSVF